MASQPRVADSRKEIIANLRLLHKLHPMLPKIAQIIFEENGLDKPSQNLFNNISYYLLFLIDPQIHSSLTWPLYDTKAERAYRSELSGFISGHAAKGHLTNVPASYLVHPSCYKVTVLMHELSVLAMKQMLIPRIKGTEKQKLYDEVTEKYNKRNDNRCFLEYMKGFNYEENIWNKLSTFLEKKQCNERIADMLRMKIIEGERKVATLNAQAYIDSLIDGFVEKNELDEPFKSEVLKIKNINEPAPIFDVWLEELDREVDSIVGKWDSKVLPLLDKCRHMQQMSEELVKRETGQIERSSYTLEYDPQRDFINTEELQSQVNNAQKYVLRNIQQNGRLNFPNLINAYVISMSYILKDHQFGNEIYDYNKRLKAYQIGLSEVKTGFKALLQRVDRAEKKLELSAVATNIQQKSIEDHLQIPPLIDLSCIKMSQNHHHINFDTFTPFNFSKYKFNLLRRGEVFTRPLPKSVLTAYHAPKDDFLKNLLSLRVREPISYDCGDKIQNGNVSVISNIKANNTISECSSGFTKQQIWRLLSTKKKSSIRKPKKPQEHINVKAKKGGLFDETVVSNDSQSLFRSYSSPNLFENVNKRPISNIRGRKLSITAEDTHPQLNVSGIACLDNNFSTSPGLEVSRSTDDFPKISDAVKNELDKVLKEDPIPAILDQESHPSKLLTASKIPRIIVQSEQESHFAKTEKARKLQESHLPTIVTEKELPNISISPVIQPTKIVTVRELQETHISQIANISISPVTQPTKIVTARELQETHISQIANISISPVTQPTKIVTARELQETHLSQIVTLRVSRSPINMQETRSTNVTPKPNTALIKKTSSLEKIINRFKQVRASVMPLKEENENLNTNYGFINRNLLPDLLSPSYSGSNGRLNASINEEPICSDSEDEGRRRPRNSLGTMLGVDHTFLDQFDLAD